VVLLELWWPLWKKELEVSSGQPVSKNWSEPRLVHQSQNPTSFSVEKRKKSLIDTQNSTSFSVEKGKELDCY
jgi:hypothetical protein